MKGKDSERVEKAIEMATKAHEGQLRKTGEPYLVHPLAVKKILEELNYKMITESVYWIDTALSKKQIFQKLGEVIHKSDDVYYVSVDSDTHKLFCEPILSLK